MTKRKLRAELKAMSLRAGRAPSTAAFRVLTNAARMLGYQSVAHASWCGQFPAVLVAARTRYWAWQYKP